MDDLLLYVWTSCCFPLCEWLCVSALQCLWRWFLEWGCFLDPNLGPKTCPRTVSSTRLTIPPTKGMSHVPPKPTWGKELPVPAGMLEQSHVPDAVGKWQKLCKPLNQWLVEYSLNKWIEGVNNTAGVAPSFESVFERHRSLQQESTCQRKGMIVMTVVKKGRSDTCKHGQPLGNPSSPMRRTTVQK